MNENMLVEELNAARKSLSRSVTPLINGEKEALNRAKSAMMKASSEILRLEEDNFKLREFIGREIT